ncbi:MAG: ArsR/SmtB family transcription factor [Candidatus Dormibacteria bacterium]
MIDVAVLATRTKGCCQELEDPVSPAAADAAAAILKALADPTRVRMLAMLDRAREPVCVCDFTAAFDLAQPTVSHHLGKLREAGLVTSHKRGIWAFYALAPDMPGLARDVVTALSRH